MKRTFYFIVFLFSCCYAVSAQPADAQAQPPVARVMNLKMAFANKELSLTPEESLKFWPAYHNYTKELRNIRQYKTDDVLAMEENVLNLRKKYKTEFKKILGSDDRVNKALTIERDFMGVVKKELQERHIRSDKQRELNQQQ